jgi:chemotaxis protein methyltransferase CheR
VSILATDINEAALEAARVGFYRDWSFRDVDEYYRRRFFIPEKGGWQISDEVISMVQFRYLNLADDLYPAMVTRTDSLDLVVCRNVMIYFNSELSVAITKRFFRCLEEGGYLLVGHSEHNELVHGEFLRRMSGGAIFYKKETPGESWEQAIKPRFRGSGKPARNLLTPSESGFRKRGDQRPPETEETVDFERAVTAYRAMRMEESLDIFQTIVAKNAANERARYMIALLLANAGKLDEAEAQVLVLLERNSLHLEGIYLLAMICRVKDEGEREIAQLKKAIYLDQEFVLGHFQMGVYYLRKGNSRLALRSLQNVLNLLDGMEETAVLDGVEGLTVGRLRSSIAALMPGRTRNR